MVCLGNICINTQHKGGGGDDDDDDDNNNIIQHCKDKRPVFQLITSSYSTAGCKQQRAILMIIVDYCLLGCYTV
jgi:hypothetical protein